MVTILIKISRTMFICLDILEAIEILFLNEYMIHKTFVKHLFYYIRFLSKSFLKYPGIFYRWLFFCLISSSLFFKDDEILMNGRSKNTNICRYYFEILFRDNSRAHISFFQSHSMYILVSPTSTPGPSSLKQKGTARNF